MQNETDLVDPYKSYSALDFVIGLLITLGASILNAFGLNLQKLSFAREELLPPSARKPEYLRPWWILGLVLYILSQVAGSTLALEFLRAEYVAPLGATSLIANFVFAYFLVGTPITRLDIIGTLVIVLGVVGVVVFGNIRGEVEFDKESNLSLSLLKEIWGRGSWISYFTVYEVTTLVFYWIAGIVDEVMRARVSDERGEADNDPTDGMMRGGRRDSIAEGWKGYYARLLHVRRTARRMIKGQVLTWSLSQPEAMIRKVSGMVWAIVGGQLAGITLILAKSGVKLVSSAISGSSPDDEGSPLKSPLTWLIIILLVLSAVMQVVCLNKGLKAYESTLVIPAFFAVYTISGFISSLVYLDEFDTYKTWVFVMIWFSIAVLSAGVLMVASKKPPVTRPRAGSLSNPDATTPGAALENPFDDPVVLGSAADPETGDAPLGKRQGWLARMFGGSPADVAAAGAPSAAEAGMSRKERRAQPGVQRLDDVEDDRASAFTDITLSQRDGPKELAGEELEMDEVDALAFEGRRESDKWDDGVDEFGEFEEAKR